jgi:lysophospholipase L1-like esterase
MKLRRVVAVAVTTVICAGVLAATSGAGRTAIKEAVASLPTPHPKVRPRTAPAHPAALKVVALGDSVTSGANCNCDAFPDIYGGLLGKRTGAKVTVDNLGVGGLNSGGLLAQLGEADSAAAVAGADVVLLTIGANDFGDHHDQVTAAACASAPGGDCVSQEIDQLSGDLQQILTKVRALRQNKTTTVLVTGYWNVYEDGEVAQKAYSPEGVAATVGLTRRVNSVIWSVSGAQGATYVDLFGPFEKRGSAVTSLLAADGDHPSADGHLLIAQVLVQVGLPKLSH